MADDAPTDDRADAASPRAVERYARRLADEGRPFARVTVVRREPPVSANVGDRAVVTPDGDLVGWVGGTDCARSVAAREARAAVADGEPRLVGLAPDPDAIDRPGLEAFPMTCHSDGTLELFVEPVTPAPTLAVVGDTPIASALVDLAGRLAYEVTAVVGDGDPGADGDPSGGGGSGTDDEPLDDEPLDDEPLDVDHPGADRVLATTDADALADALGGATAVVVASMGAFDEAGVEAGLRVGAPYVGLVSSDRRAREVFGRVADRTGRDPGEVADAVTVPAGVDVGAETAGEIAVSILAELVAVRRSGGAAGPDTTATGDTHIPEGSDTHDTDTHDATDPSDTDDTATHDSDDRSDTDDTHASDTDDSGGHDPDDVGTDDDAGTDPDDARTDPDDARTDPETAVDPVCGMTVDVAETPTVEHDGEEFYFCGEGCAEAFADDPDRFVGREVR